MNFGHALQILKSGGRVAREGWNGKSMWLIYIPAAQWAAVEVNAETGPIGRTIPMERLPWIGMKTADNKFVPWLASQTDLLAEDWEIV